MATLICNGTGNLTGTTTFAGAEAGALAAVLNRNTTTSIATATTVTSVTFTVTNLKVIDGALLWLKTSGTTGTGTFKVDLQKGGVSQAAVTVNKSDLPDSTNTIGCPVFFKFTSTATGDGGSNWTLVLTTTSGTGSATVTINIASATTTNYTRALRTTTAATATTTDDLYIVGELTGAAAHTSRTVTMDQTAATDYCNGSVNSTTVSGGLVAISNYGTLTYDITVNALMRVSGDMMVFQNGALNIGNTTGGNEVPRNKTAILEFDQTSADGDFGLRCLDNSTVNIAGLSRTSAKNIVKCKLNSDLAAFANAFAGGVVVNGSATGSAGLEPSGTSLLCAQYTDNVTNGVHGVNYSAPTVTNTTQTFRVYLARGTGTNTRFIRLTVGNNATLGSVTNGFFSDIDLQAGTAGTVTAVGNGTATSVAIVASGIGYIVTIIGKCSTASTTPFIHISVGTSSGNTSYAGDTTRCFYYASIANAGAWIITASSIADTSLSVDTDTGWLSGDVVAVASTSRTFSEGELFLLNANAGVSSMTSTIPASYAHSGTSPTQGEVALLTRNVRIRSTSSSLMSYVYVTALSSFTAQWAEFYFIGVNTTNKRGVEVDCGTTASAKSITYCTVRDTEVGGFYTAAGSTSFNMTFSNNVMWFCNQSFNINSTITNTDWVVDSNISIRTLTSTGTCYNLSDIGGTFTNNTAAGANNQYGILLQETLGTIGTFSGNVSHSNGSGGMGVTASISSGTIGTFTAWRNSNFGIAFTSASLPVEASFDSLTLFGNTTANLYFTNSCNVSVTGTNIMAGDASFATTSNFYFDTNSGCYNINISGIDMSGSGTGLAACTNEFFSNATFTILTGTANNCKFGAANFFSDRTKLTKYAYIGMERYGQANGAARTEMRYGQILLDTSIFNAATPSMRMTPNSASVKLESAPKGSGILAAVASGGTVSVSVYVRKSVIGDGTAYNGNQPRLIQRANPALGQNADVPLATAAAAAGSWELLTATSSAATDAGAWEFIVDCDGTTGWVNVDDWLLVGASTTTNDLKNWFNGLPAVGIPGVLGQAKLFQRGTPF